MSDQGISLQTLMAKYRPNIKLIRISLRCPRCGHEWGVKIDNLDNIPSRDEAKFLCFECAKQLGLSAMSGVKS